MKQRLVLTSASLARSQAKRLPLFFAYLKRVNVSLVAKYKMLIGLCGGKLLHCHRSIKMANGSQIGICAGKKTIADYLVKHHSFSQLRLSKRIGNAHEDSLLNGMSKDAINTKATSSAKSDHEFSTISDLVDFVTSKWQQHWVTTDIDNEEFLTGIVRRPFFLFVSVDAPIHIRWSRSRIK